MKNFLLKKMNRGIALAIALIVGLIIFFIADSVAFAREEPMLKDFLEEYLEEASKINLLPEQYRASDTDIPDSVITAKTKETKDFIEKYFTEYKNPMYAYNESTKNYMLMMSDIMYSENQKGGGVIKDLSYSLIKITNIQKLATDAVSISFMVDMSLSASPYASFLNLTQYSHGQMFMNYSEEYADEIQDINEQLSMTFTLFKVNGKWKIAEATYYGGRYDGYSYTVMY